MLGAAPRTCRIALGLLLCATVLGAGASSASVSVPAAADVRLPKAIWAMELDASGRVDAKTLRSYRAEGFNAALAETRRVSKRRLAALRRGASKARLLLLTTRSVKPSACAALRRKAKRCVIVASAVGPAIRMARSKSVSLVVVRLKNVGELQSLRGRSRGRILALARLDGQDYDLAAWKQAAELAESDPLLDLGVTASGARRDLAAQRFGKVKRGRS